MMEVEGMDADTPAARRGGGGIFSSLGRETAGSRDANNLIPTPDQSLQNSMVVDDSQQNDDNPSRPQNNDKLIPPPKPQMQTLPLSPENSQLPSQSPPPQLSSSPPTSNPNTLLPSFHLGSPPPAQQHASWTHTKSPPSGSNPFFTSSQHPHSYRSSTPPIPSSAEQSPLISPAKRFSTGEVKPLYAPNSPRQPLNEEDRLKFSQLATQLKTRLTYAAIKVENGWEKHSFHQIQNLLNDTPNTTTHSRRRSHTMQDHHHHQHPTPGDLPPTTPTPPGKLTYESFWASHSQNRHHNPHPSYTPPTTSTRGTQPVFHATFPRRKPERLSLQGIAGTASSGTRQGGGHTARDQSAAEIMIALASPRTRSEFSSPERGQGNGVPSDDEGEAGLGRESPSVRARKRIELDKDRDVEGLGIHA